MTTFDELGGYEKGVVAQALLVSLIKQGRFGRVDDANFSTEIIIPVKRWQLELLGCFSQTGEKKKVA